VAALWLDTRSRIGATQEELARRLRDIETEGREARSAARQAQDGLRDALAKIVALETRISESQAQQAALEGLYQELARNRDEWQLAEIEQVLAIAQQQLQLSGNVRAGLLALQLAESRLSRSDRPQFLAVRRALARDIERLKSLPGLDLPGMSLRLDGLVASVDTLPLAYEERAGRDAAAAAKPVKPAAEEGKLERLGAEIWRELRQLVVVRKIEGQELRLLNARLGLLTRNEAGYREDLRAAQAWIQRYFDARSKAAQAALAQLKQLSSATLSFEAPSIADSLEAVRGFKTRREPR
jgi:uroporphyrin-3 C-methyltransferase